VRMSHWLRSIGHQWMHDQDFSSASRSAEDREGSGGHLPCITGWTKGLLRTR